MKLLEELKLEQARRTTPIPGTSKEAARAVAASEEVLRSIETLYSGLADLADGLNQLETDAHADFEIESVGVMRELHQRRYRVLADDPTLPRFALTFECAGSRPLTAIVPTAAHRDALVAKLSELGMKFRVDGTSASRFAIVIEPLVPVLLRFAPTADGSSIRLTVHNLKRPGRELYTISPAQVCEELIGELGKLILRRDNQFAQLTGNCISPEARARLRERLRSGDSHTACHHGPTPSDAEGAELRRGRDGARRAHGAARRAPVMLSESSAAEGFVEWNSASAAPQLSQARITGDNDDTTSRTNGAGRLDGGLFRLARYAWVITTDVLNPEPSESIAKRGPRGTSQAYPTSKVLNEGDDFRLMAADGTVRYLGMIAGSYRGIEPLLEFGNRHGCRRIAYQRNGQWVAEQAEE